MPPSLAQRRLLVLLPSLEMGGAERQGLMLARYLREKEQADVQLWSLGATGPVREQAESFGIPVQVVPTGWSEDRKTWWKAFLRLGWQMGKFRPDALLPFTIRPNVYCGLLWRWVGARTCIWNQRDEGRALRVGLNLQKRAARWTPQFVSNSEHGRDFLIESLGVHVARVQKVDNGIELAPAQASRTVWRKRLGVSKERLLVCMVANVHRYKDHKTLLQAWARVFQNFARPASPEPPLLLLAGRKGSTFNELSRLVTELGLQGQVRFLGLVKDVSGLLNSVDLGVFSSLWEGTPNGVLECMAAGLALVATDIPGIRLAFEPESRPFLVPPHDTEALASKLLQLLQDAPLRNSLGKKNRQWVRAHYSPEQMGQQMAELLKQDCRSS